MVARFTCRVGVVDGVCRRNELNLVLQSSGRRMQPGNRVEKLPNVGGTPRCRRRMRRFAATYASAKHKKKPRSTPSRCQDEMIGRHYETRTIPGSSSPTPGVPRRHAGLEWEALSEGSSTAAAERQMKFVGQDVGLSAPCICFPRPQLGGRLFSTGKTTPRDRSGAWSEVSRPRSRS